MPIGVDDLGLASILAWVWKEYGKTIVDKASKAAWERVRWMDKARAYSEKVRCSMAWTKWTLPTIKDGT